MEPITLERYLNEPDLDVRLHAEARRARTVLMGRLLISLLERLTPRPGRIHWIARLG